MSHHLPTLLIDTREQAPLAFSVFTAETAKLSTADYSIKGMESDLMIERKSVSDLLGSLTSERDRFNRELDRMSAARVKVLLIVGEKGGSLGPREAIASHTYRSKTPPHVAFASLASIEARGITIRWAKNPAHAARIVETLSWYAWRAALKRVGIRPPATPKPILTTLEHCA